MEVKEVLSLLLQLVCPVPPAALSVRRVFREILRYACHLKQPF
jgi:hypothetical protein